MFIFIIRLDSNHVIGHTTNLMTIYKDLYKLDPITLFYRIDLTVESITSLGPNTGYSSLVFVKNLLPKPGSCTLFNNVGIASLTYFEGNINSFKAS
jgi:hypothetical protein